jgi:hypothetical protein
MQRPETKTASTVRFVLQKVFATGPSFFCSTEKFSTRGDAINIFASAPPNLLLCALSGI